MKLSMFFAAAALLLLPLKSLTGDLLLTLHQWMLCGVIVCAVAEGVRVREHLNIVHKVAAAFGYVMVVVTLVAFFRWGFDFEPVLLLRDLKNVLLPLAAGLLLALVPVTYQQYLAVIRIGVVGGAFLSGLERLLWSASPSLYLRLFEPPFEGIRHTAGFLSPNSYGLYLVILMYFLCIFAANEPRWWVKLGYYGLGAIQVPVLLSTYSRGSLVVAVLVALALFWQSTRFDRWLLIGGGVAVAVYIAQDSYLLARLQVASLADSGRDALFAAAINMFYQHPFTGVGLSRYGLAAFQDLGELKLSHNGYLKVAAEMGFPGLTALVGLYISMAYLAFRSMRRASSNEARWVSGMALTVVGCFVIGDVFFSYLFENRIALLFWLMALPLLARVYAVTGKEGRAAL